MIRIGNAPDKNGNLFSMPWRKLQGSSIIQFCICMQKFTGKQIRFAYIQAQERVANSLYAFFGLYLTTKRRIVSLFLPSP